MSDNYTNFTALQRFKEKIVALIGAKQDTLVSGTNIKTINNTSLLGSGNINIQGGGSDVFIADTSQNTPTEVLQAYSSGKVVYLNTHLVIGAYEHPDNGDVIATIYTPFYDGYLTFVRYYVNFSTNSWGSNTTFDHMLSNDSVEQTYAPTSVSPLSGVAVAQAIGTKANLVPTPVNGEVLITDADGQPQSSGTDLTTLLSDVEAGKEAFMLKDFNQQINLTIPSVTQDIANTSIPNMDVDLDVIDPTGELNTKYAIAGIAKYEIYDAASGGNRLNAFPVCSFSMNGQRTLRLRCMVGGPNSKTARRISGALLLKHR